MSAITGFYHLDGRSVDASLLCRMTSALAHRGPDECNTCQVGPVGFGHCMLRTTPESLHEHLPFTTNNDTLTITADARIDNRDELIRDLELGQREGILPDSYLILCAYQCWGESCVDHLLGDFAFAIWDGQKQHIFCARDHMGVRPFYYYRSPDCFVFSSEIKALFCVPGIPREVNEKTIAFRLAGIDPDPAITPYLQIHRLPAAHTMTVSSSETRMHRYWSLDPNCEIRFQTTEEYETSFRNIFTEAVRCRMRSAFPVGAELSGGLDSSAIVCVARHLIRQEKSEDQVQSLHTFSAVFNEVPESDERTYIQYVLAGGDVESHFIYPEQISPLQDISYQISLSEEPSISATSHTYRILYQTAKDTGVRIVLSGEWGDGVVSYGTGVLLDFAFAGKWYRTIKEVMSLSKNFGVKKRNIIWYNLLAPLVPDVFRKDSEGNPVTWIKDDFSRRTGLVGYFLDLRKKELKLRTSREYHFHVLSSQNFSLGLEIINKSAAAYSVEPSFPFLDRRVIEFCLALPPEQRLRHGYHRLIEREGLSEYLPPEIRYRKNKGPADPYIRYGLIKFEGGTMNDLLLDHSDLLRPYIDLDVIREKYRKLMEGTATNLIPLWRTIVLAFWLREEKLKKLGEKKIK